MNAETRQDIRSTVGREKRKVEVMSEVTEEKAAVAIRERLDTLAKWLFEFRYPDHEGYWDAGHTPEFTKNQFRKKADELAALSPAPLTINREAIVKAITSVSEHDPDTHDFISPEKAADAVLAALSTQPAAGEVEWGAALHERPTVVVPSIDEQHARESADEWNNHPNVTSGKLPRMMVLTRIAPQWIEVQS